jgi:hypothetical protein
MKYAFCAGAFVLAMIGSLATVPAASAGEWSNNYSTQRPASASIDIVRIHSVLQLNQEQERYWRPVEAALRDLARHQERSENEGIVRRVSRRIVQIALDSAAVHRLAIAARPLIARLTDQQKQAAGQLAQEMGLGPVVTAALN